MAFGCRWLTIHSVSDDHAWEYKCFPMVAVVAWRIVMSNRNTIHINCNNYLFLPLLGAMIGQQPFKFDCSSTMLAVCKYLKHIEDVGPKLMEIQPQSTLATSKLPSIYPRMANDGILNQLKCLGRENNTVTLLNYSVRKMNNIMHYDSYCCNCSFHVCHPHAFAHRTNYALAEALALELTGQPVLHKSS